MASKKMKNRWKNTIIAFILSLAFAAPATAVNIRVGGGQRLDLSGFEIIHQETFESNRSPEEIFWGVLDVGQKANDPWTGMLTRDAYVLTHTGNSGAVRYYFRQKLDGGSHNSLSEAAICVDVSGTMNGDISGAGLIYGYNPQTKHYLAFIKGAGRSYAIYKRNAEGMRKIMGGTSKAVTPGQVNQLAIVPQGSNINFYINGTHVAEMKDEPTSGGAGIMAISSGMFLFDNFTLYRSFKPEVLPSIPHQGDKPSAPADTAANTTENAEAPPPAQTDDQTSAEKAANKLPAQAPESQQKMLRSYKDSLKPGMTKQRVIEMFGAPSWERGSRFYYPLGKKDSGDDLHTLIIQFDETDRILKFVETQE